LGRKKLRYILELLDGVFDGDPNNGALSVIKFVRYEAKLPEFQMSAMLPNRLKLDGMTSCHNRNTLRWRHSKARKHGCAIDEHGERRGGIRLAGISNRHKATCSTIAGELNRVSQIVGSILKLGYIALAYCKQADVWVIDLIAGDSLRRTIL